MNDMEFASLNGIPLDKQHLALKIVAQHQRFVVAKLQEGKDAWNAWREENTDEFINSSGVDFSKGKAKHINFNGYEFRNKINFSKATFGDHTHFFQAKFGRSIYFNEATFGDLTQFHETTFGNGIYFNEATFGDHTEFNEATFSDHTHFKKATFGKVTEFNEATFGNFTYFDEATFGDHTHFFEATFGNITYFKQATFGNITHFNRTKFGNYTYFDETTFSGESDFSGITKGLHFSLSQAEFKSIPEINLQSEDDKVRYVLTGVQFRLPSSNSPTNSTISNLQTIKSIADTTGEVNVSRDLFILQRQAERDVSWSRYNFLSLQWHNLGTLVTRSVMATTFRLFADYGRSVLRPVVVWAGSIGFFYVINRAMYRQTLFAKREGDMLDYTLSNSIPFGKLLNPGFDQAITDLFGSYKTEVVDGANHIVSVIDIPISFQIVGMLQSSISVILLFLIGLGIRNYFKIS